MNFVAPEWCKQAILSITTIYCCGGIIVPSIAEKSEQQINFEYNSLPTNYQQKERICQKIDPTYQNIYNFEIESYYINICQQENSFYYHRQSKLDPTNTTLIQATAVFGGNVFQATKGKTIYFVGKDGDRYYSSVVLNNNEIVLEPALLPTPASFTPDIIERGVSFSFGNTKISSLNPTINTVWHPEFALSRQNADNSLVCIRDSSVINSGFDNWQSLIGQSTEVANNYALNRGYSFVYDRVSPNKASIETKEGKTINLNIASTSKIIEQVCVQQTDNIQSVNSQLDPAR